MKHGSFWTLLAGCVYLSKAGLSEFGKNNKDIVYSSESLIVYLGNKIIYIKWLPKISIVRIPS